MGILDKFDWGETKNFKETTIKEIFQDGIYEKFFEVEEGDIVVDFGSTIGDFIWSIKDKNPKHCWAVEPVDSYFETMKKNLFCQCCSLLKNPGKKSCGENILFRPKLFLCFYMD